MPLRWGVVCLWMIAGIGVWGAAPARAQDPVYDESGGQYGRGFFAPLPFEAIDVVTGNLMLKFTDLALPGNAGSTLAIVRTYNSRDAKWRFGVGGVPLYFLFNPSNPDLSDVDFVTADGARHNAAGAGATTLTREFWQFTKATRVLEMPNGIVATYGHLITDVGAYLTEIRDPFDNVITLNWQSGTDTLLSIVQDLGFNQVRTITFNGWTSDMTATMSFDGRTWTYEWNLMSGTAILTKVTPPAGGQWHFSYVLDSEGAVKLQSLTTANGGTVSYTWGTDTFPTTPANRVVVRSRTTGGRAPAGTWDLDWFDTGRQLVINGPANRLIYETEVVEDVPVATKRTVATLQGTPLETETMTYDDTLPHPIEPRPAIKTRVIDRGGQIYTTTYTYDSANWANYGQPTRIVESGHLTRTTDITYDHNFAKYIRGRVASVTVDGIGVRSFAYNSVTGFVDAATSLGVTTLFGPTPSGNIDHARDALNRRTNFYYGWGVMSGSDSPISTTFVTRTINHDGTVASETISNISTTSYGYDGAGRVTSVSTNTPGQVPVTTTYTVSNGAWVSTTTTRGSVWVTTEIDGWGRPVHTSDSTGVHSRVVYDGAGRQTYASRPYGTGVAEVGVDYTYDSLGRVASAIRHDGTGAYFDYPGLSVVRNEQQSAGVWRATSSQYRGFGSPGDARLWKVVDHAGATWTYFHDSLGNLTGVDSNMGAYRTWDYSPQGWPLQFTQLESGTTSYQYDGVGNVTYAQDARGPSFGVSYQYDSHNRVTLVNAPGTTDDVSTAYDAVGRVSAVSSAAVQSTFAYDAGSRLTGRTDVIGGHSFAQTFAYNGHDNLTQANYPRSGRKVFYDYDAQQRLTAVRTQVGTGPITTLAHTFVYRGDGTLVSYAFGNGQTASTTLDARQRPEHWVNGPLDVTYAYDYVGNIKSITDPRSGQSSQFSYDLLDRLTTVTGFGATSFTYTGTGDRLTAGTVNFHYNAKQQLASLSGGASGSFTYDDIGSLTSDPSGAAYTYTTHAMLKTSTLNSQTTSYQYGGSGQRAIKTGPNGVPHLFVYGAGGELIAEYRVGGPDVQLVREYVYLGGQLLASFEPAAVAPPPLSVGLLTPTQGQTVGYGQGLTLTATASAGGGLTIARVEYYNGGVFIGQSSTAPYSVPWNNLPLPAGAFTFIARVVTTDGRAVSSAPVTITVQ